MRKIINFTHATLTATSTNRAPGKRDHEIRHCVPTVPTTACCVGAVGPAVPERSGDVRNTTTQPMQAPA